MSLASCIASAKAYAKENEDVKLSPSDIDRLGKILSNAEDKGATPAEKNALMAKAIDDILQVSLARKQASRYLQVLSETRNMADMKANLAEFVKQGLTEPSAAREAILTRIRGGLSRKGIASLDPRSIFHSAQEQYWGILKNSLEPRDFDALRTSSAGDSLQSGVVQELYAIRNKMQLGQSNNDMALRLAKSMRETQDAVLKDVKGYNPFVSENQDFLFSRSHNRDLIQAMGKDAWVKQASKNFAPSFPGLDGTEKVKAFEKLYKDIIAGTSDSNEYDKSSFWKKPTQGGDVAKATAGTRVLQAASWQDEVEYMKACGDGLYNSIDKQISYQARNLAIFKKWGPNPTESFQREYGQLKASLSTPDAQVEFERHLPDYKKAFEQTIGRQDNEAHGLVAKSGENLLLASELGALGLHVPRALNGIQGALSLIKDQNGRGLIENAHQLATSLFSKFAPFGKGGQDMADTLGISVNGVSREAIGDFARGGATQPGVMAKTAQLMGQISLGDRYTRALKTASAELQARSLGLVADKSFGDLHPGTQSWLQRYSLGGARWEALREAVEQDGRGKNLVTPEAIRNLPDETVAQVLKAEGTAKPKPRDLDRMRTDLALNYGTGLNSDASLSSGQADSRALIAAFGNTTINSAEGLARRMLFQFKMHAFAQQELTMRIARANGPDSNLGGLFTHILGTTFMSAMGEGLIALAAGKTLPSPTDPKTAGKLLLASGGLGLYGDAIANGLIHSSGGDRNWSMGSEVLGPSFSLIEKGIKAVGKTTSGGISKSQGEYVRTYGSKEWAELLQSVTPGNNLFYAKAAIDATLINKLHEFLGDDGYLDRLEKSVRRTPGLGGGQQQYTFGGKNFWGQ